MKINQTASLNQYRQTMQKTAIQAIVVTLSAISMAEMVGLWDQVQAQDQAAEKNAQVIKVQLSELGGVAEWVRVEARGNRVKLFHSIMSPSGIARIMSSVIPFSISHTWYDHPTLRIVFQPDGCQDTAPPVNYTPASSSTCLVSGRDFVDLPAGTSLFQGRFTVEYLRNNLPSSVTFRVPQQNDQK